MNSRNNWVVESYSLKKALIRTTQLEGVWYVREMKSKGYWLMWTPEVPGKLIEVDNSAMISVTYLD